AAWPEPLPPCRGAAGTAPAENGVGNCRAPARRLGGAKLRLFPADRGDRPGSRVLATRPSVWAAASAPGRAQFRLDFGGPACRSTWPTLPGPPPGRAARPPAAADAAAPRALATGPAKLQPDGNGPRYDPGTAP